MGKKRGKKPDGFDLTRRQFMKDVGIAGGSALLANIVQISGCTKDRNKAANPNSSSQQDPPQDTSAPLPTRPLGGMGFNASILGMGGACLANGREAVSMAILNRALELGITYYDTASTYAGGESERRYGRWLERLEREDRRKDIFLATKTLSRTYDEAVQEIEASFARLRTSYIDLLQVHSINDIDSWRAASGQDGSMRAIMEAKEDGRIGHIGITGHKDPAPILAALEDFPFESVLSTLGIEDRFVGASFVRDGLPKYVEKGVSIVAMKVFGEGQMAREGIDLEKCLHYTLSLPVSAAIIGMSSPEQVRQNVAWAKSFGGMNEEEVNTFAGEVETAIDPAGIWWKK